MEFPTIFKVLKKHMADGHDVPYFFRELIETITDLPEDEWGLPHDPSGKLTDETLRTYSKRKLTGKFASSIAYRLTLENIKERINDLPELQRKNLALDFTAYDSTVDADNVADKVAGWIEEIVFTSAGLAPVDELEKQKQQKASGEYKAEYGNYLLRESEHSCSFPGCGHDLTLTDNGKAIDSYEVSLIDKSGKAEPSNMVAMCPRCYAAYQIDGSKKTLAELQRVKKMQSSHRKMVQLLDDLPLEKGIAGVIGRIKQLKEKDLTDASLDPKEIKQKIDPDVEYQLFRTVNDYVLTYYVRIREILMNLDKRGEIDYEEIQDQMRAIYRRLNKSNKSQLAIFTEITNKIHKVSLQEDMYCQIVVSYFIQSCEVFDAIT